MIIHASAVPGQSPHIRALAHMHTKPPHMHSHVRTHANTGRRACGHAYTRERTRTYTN